MCTYNQLFHTLICYISKSFAVDIFFYICSRYVKGEILLMLVLNSNQSINHTFHAGIYKVWNEIETKRNETKRNQRKRNEPKRNET